MWNVFAGAIKRLIQAPASGKWQALGKLQLMGGIADHSVLNVMSE